jgi:hypothetical protein
VVDDRERRASPRRRPARAERHGHRVGAVEQALGAVRPLPDVAVAQRIGVVVGHNRRAKPRELWLSGSARGNRGAEVRSGRPRWWTIVTRPQTIFGASGLRDSLPRLRWPAPSVPHDRCPATGLRAVSATARQLTIPIAEIRLPATRPMVRQASGRSRRRPPMQARCAPGILLSENRVEGLVLPACRGDGGGGSRDALVGQAPLPGAYSRFDDALPGRRQIGTGRCEVEGNSHKQD